MTVTVKIYIALAALLLLVGATTCGYERGVSHGKSIEMLAHDDSVRAVDAQTIAKLTQTVHEKDVLAQWAKVKMHTDSVLLERAQAKRDTSRAFANAERALFTLKGDTAIVGGLAYVLPQTVSTSIRLSDVAIAKQGELDAAKAQSDSNTSRTIARLEDLGASKDTLITSLRTTVSHDNGEIKDLKAMKAPRLRFIHGIVVGALLIGSLLHFIR